MPRDVKQKHETFEQLYARLEAHVAKLEEGNLALDDAIALYEEGMDLARACQERLDAAEQRITKLKESFAQLDRRNGAALSPEPADYEYVADEAFGDEADEDIP
jgi:exodeoxyribonuclease VII small subunit